MNFKVFLSTFFLILFFFLLNPVNITSLFAAAVPGTTVAKVFDNSHDLNVFESSAKKRKSQTYFLKIIFDFSSLPDNDCDYYYKILQKTLLVPTKEFISKAGLYCWQKKNESGQFVSFALRINHAIESLGTDESDLAVAQFLKDHSDQEVFSTKVHYSPVIHFSKERKLRAFHSFWPYRNILEEVFFTKVDNLTDFAIEEKTILNNIDFKSRENYQNFIANVVRSTQTHLWMKLFNNPDADVLFLTQQNNYALLQTESGTQEEIVDQIFSSYDFVDTRWDEFIDKNLDFSESEPENYVIQQVCVKVDTLDTASSVYPNRASNVKASNDSFSVKTGGTYCFDYHKSYYMMHYLYGNSNALWYGTVCRYLPFMRHEGHTLYYEGEHGGHKCPVR